MIKLSIRGRVLLLVFTSLLAALLAVGGRSALQHLCRRGLHPGAGT